MAAALGLLGGLTGPPSKANAGACALLQEAGGALFCYAVSSAVVVIDVSCLSFLSAKPAAYVLSLGPAGQDTAGCSDTAGPSQVVACHRTQLVRAVHRASDARGTQLRHPDACCRCEDQGERLVQGGSPLRCAVYAACRQLCDCAFQDLLLAGLPQAMRRALSACGMWLLAPHWPCLTMLLRWACDLHWSF